jgi:Icc-related predicted phosphoesterase
MKFVCISDTHNQHENLEFDGTEGDILVHTGDFTDFGNLKKLKKFIFWFQNQPFPIKILVAGNHDVSLDKDTVGDREVINRVINTYVRTNPNFIYLDESGHEIDGIKIWGSPYTPGGPTKWAFQYFTDEEAESRWSKIPEDTDVLLTHGPPFGILDKYKGENLGCPILYKHVTERVAPVFHCFGHVHNGHGFEKCGLTTFVNSAMVLDDWAGNPPIVFEIERDRETKQLTYSI